MSTDARYVTFSDQNFEREVLESDQPVLVDFWAAWCGPCRAIGPLIEQLAEKYEGRAKIGKLNVDENPASAVRYGVRSIPILLYFENGRLADRSVGLVSRGAIESKLEALLQDRRQEERSVA